jgi:hypothetical protein
VIVMPDACNFEVRRSVLTRHSFDVVIEVDPVSSHNFFRENPPARCL